MNESTAVQGVAHVETVRNAGGGDIMALLERKHTEKVDLIVPAKDVKFVDGILTVTGLPIPQVVVVPASMDETGVTPEITVDGVNPNGRYWPTQGFDDQLAARLDIAPAFLRRLRHGRVLKDEKVTSPARLDLYDANVNGLMGGRKPKLARASIDDLLAPADDPSITYNEATDQHWRTVREGVPADSRSFFLRLMKSEGGLGIARAVLSNRFARMDNIDALTAMMKGMEQAGIDPNTIRVYGDLSETRMFVHVAAPQILAAAPGLLEGYRSPFDVESENVKRRGHHLTMAERIELGRQFRERGRGDGNHGFYQPGNEPLVHAGFLLSNSEVGSGRWQIRPEITVLRCSNGLTMTKDGFGKAHVGRVNDDGFQDWSEDTQKTELKLVMDQTRDVVRRVLSVGYLEEKIAELESKAGKVVEQPDKTIEVVSTKLKFSLAEREGILRHFFLGGTLTSGGVMQAVTSFSQTLENSDAAHDLNERAIAAMEIAFAM